MPFFSPVIDNPPVEVTLAATGSPCDSHPQQQRERERERERERATRALLHGDCFRGNSRVLRLVDDTFVDCRAVVSVAAAAAAAAAAAVGVERRDSQWVSVSFVSTEGSLHSLVSMTCRFVLTCQKTVVCVLSAFPMFVPSLSW